MRFIVAFVLLAGCSWSLGQTSAGLPELIAEAEKFLYAFDAEDHLDRVEKTLLEIERKYPKEPYVHWARARVAFWKKEACYVEEKKSGKDRYKEKLKLADECHSHSDRCLELGPKNAECHLMKGVCYAMQGSTWGGHSFKTLGILKPMDREFEKASTLPTNFVHMGELSTRNLALSMRGILYRLMPESWWFGLIAGVRGDKEKAYRWIHEGIQGPLLKEPVTVLELGVTAICYGQTQNKPEAISEGMALLRKGKTLRSRFALDDWDKRNMEYLLELPQESCKYRRERFEDINDQSIRAGLRQQED